MTKLQKQPKAKKPFYKKWYTWALAIIVVIAIGTNTEEAASPEIKVVEPVTENTEAAAAPKEEAAAPKEAAPKKEAAPVDNTPKEHKAALSKAKMYAKTMAMSKAAIHNQLTSEHGEKFSQEAADYAMANLTFDWNANALEKAKMYQETMDMSQEAIRDQLTSSFGEQFTQEEADFAIDNL